MKAELKTTIKQKDKYWMITVTTLGLFIAAIIDNFSLGIFATGTIVNPTIIIWTAMVAAILFLSFFRKSLDRVTKFLMPLKWITPVIAAIILFLFPLIIFNSNFPITRSFFTRIFLLWLIGLAAALLLKTRFPERKFVHLLLYAILFATALYQAASFLRDLTTYIFSLAWSEGSRFYYASLPFSRSLYGQMLPWSFLHPARYLLMAIPFLFGRLPLWFHRGWQIFLWISLTLLGCLTIIRRFNINDGLISIASTAWCFIFLLQGPVYYHLMVCAILVLWGFDRDNRRKSFFFVLLASLWAGICRVNWFPVPAALAILLYTMERPIADESKILRYLRDPFLFGILGMSASLISQAAYIPISGNLEPGLFATSFTSDLLWYRLLPSPTYPVGILTGLLILISPLVVLIMVNYRKNIASMHWLRQLIILAILLVFLAGGLVVSVKIGGGSNLHNLDAFLLLLAILCGYVIFKHIQPDHHSDNKVMGSSLLMILLVLIPVCWSVLNWEPYHVPDKAAAFQDLQHLNETVQRVAATNDNILFIAERHLLTFDFIKGIHLIPEYELLSLMEMAISKNPEYLNRFYDDLKNQRFSLIIMDKQYVIFKDETTAFPEENNAWVRSIAIPVLEYYQPITWLRSTDTEIFAPRDLSILRAH